jgi:hypothetical protein
VQRGFFKSLFDLSFTSFVTTRLMKVLYVLSLALVLTAYGTIALTLFASGVGDSMTVGADGALQTHRGGSTALGLAWLFVIGPLFLAFHTLAFRVTAEVFVVLFRIAENSRDQLAITRAAWSAAADATVASGEAPPAD